MKAFQPVTRLEPVVNDGATAKRARKYRMTLGIKLTDAAAKMGISACHLSELERGLRTWTPTMIKKFKLLKNSTR